MTQGVRTKYDRMFERKNQNILSNHYSNLIDHSDSDGSEDFITLKRTDHALSDDEGDASKPGGAAQSGLSSHHVENISKRKLKIGESKKLMAKYKSTGTKLVFDDEGEAHAIYEMKDDVEFRDKKRAKELGREFAEQQRGQMVQADAEDKEVAKDKKKEKKRKRKERERGEMAVRLFFISPIESNSNATGDSRMRMGQRSSNYRKMMVMKLQSLTCLHFRIMREATRRLGGRPSELAAHLILVGRLDRQCKNRSKRMSSWHCNFCIGDKHCFRGSL